MTTTTTPAIPAPRGARRAPGPVPERVMPAGWPSAPRPHGRRCGCKDCDWARLRAEVPILPMLEADEAKLAAMQDGVAR